MYYHKGKTFPVIASNHVSQFLRHACLATRWQAKLFEEAHPKLPIKIILEKYASITRCVAFVLLFK